MVGSFLRDIAMRPIKQRGVPEKGVFLFKKVKGSFLVHSSYGVWPGPLKILRGMALLVDPQILQSMAGLVHQAHHSTIRSTTCVYHERLCYFLKNLMDVFR
jgi:hypothetical protein